jgi:tetratricopeptide (TPR) repeat protein
MVAPDGSATNVVQLGASGRREAKIVAAARVLSIDYQSIVETTVAGLAVNTPDTRGEVYAQARDIVNRHLELMQLPEPIVEVERLALDVTIKKIESRWLAPGETETGLLDDSPEPPIESQTDAPAAGSVAEALTALGAAIKALLTAIATRPAMSAASFIARPLRPLMKPTSLALATPVIATAILLVLVIDNHVTYQDLVDSPAGQWLSRLQAGPSTPGPSTPAPRSAAAMLDEVSSVGAVRTAAASGRAATAEPVPLAPMEYAPGGDRAPARLAPLGGEVDMAPVSPEPAVPPPGCGSGLPISERLACADEGPKNGAGAETARSGAEPPWLAGFAALSEAVTGRAPTMTPATPPQTSGDAPLPRTATLGAPEATAAAPAMALPDAGRAAPLPRTPLVQPINPKVTALIANGKRAVLNGDLDRAVRDFGEAIRIDPKHPDGYAERGQALFKLGETERAIADYSAALGRDPQHGAALRARGMAYLYKGSADMALADLSRTIDLAARDPSLMPPIEVFYARRSRGSIYDSKQQYELEIQDCTALIDSYARDPMLVEALKANYGDAGAANILATIYRQRANAHMKRSDGEHAVADLTAAIPLSSDRGYSALVDRSRLHEGLGRNDLAVADLQAALGIRPGSEEARLALKRLGAPARPPKGF